MLLIISIGACTSPSSNTNEDTAVDTEEANSASSSSPTDETSVYSDNSPWERHQDSLRQVLLQSKNDEILKQSLFSELYLRGLARRTDGQVQVSIPFDLHSNDAGAPDCYINELNFKFPVEQKVEFPESLVFYEREHGCIDKESTTLGKFTLQEETKEQVVYVSERPARTLVLFSGNQKSGSYAYYFASAAEELRGERVYTVVEEYTEESDDSLFPYRSSILSTNEYERFFE